MENNPEFQEHVAVSDKPGGGQRFLTSIVTDGATPPPPAAPFSTRASSYRPTVFGSLSRHHHDHPYVLRVGRPRATVSTTSPRSPRRSLFGGNSNWRGPVWYPINYLLVESLQKFHYFFGDNLKVACPSGSDSGC